MFIITEKDTLQPSKKRNIKFCEKKLYIQDSCQTCDELVNSQMREKLELMRQKKTEYLQYQRQLAMQRMQEQERDMMLRQEQSRQQYHQVNITKIQSKFSLISEQFFQKVQ